MLDSGGIGTYLAELLPRVIALVPEATFTLLGDPEKLQALAGHVAPVDIREWRTPIYTVREQLDIPRLLPRDTSVFWSPHFNVPLVWRGPLVVTVHDVAHLALPQRSLARTLYARHMFATVRRRAHSVLCDSAFTRRELEQRSGPARRALVCHLGVARHWFSLRRATPETPYFLYVGNVKPHKNLARLLDAFSRIQARIPHRLMIVGRREGMRTIDHESAVRAERLGDRVQFTGQVSAAQLERHVADCDALVLPSLYEGFGLPPLEALACGRPVVVSAAGSLPEVCGPLADYFDPLDVTSIADALERVATRPPDSWETLERRRQWARRFDWASCAETTAAELRDALREKVR